MPPRRRVTQLTGRSCFVFFRCVSSADAGGSSERVVRQQRSVQTLTISRACPTTSTTDAQCGPTLLAVTTQRLQRTTSAASATPAASHGIRAPSATPPPPTKRRHRNGQHPRRPPPRWPLPRAVPTARAAPSDIAAPPNAEHVPVVACSPAPAVGGGHAQRHAAAEAATAPTETTSGRRQPDKRWQRATRWRWRPPPPTRRQRRRGRPGCVSANARRPAPVAEGDARPAVVTSRPNAPPP